MSAKRKRAKARSGSKRFAPLKPINLSDDEREMFRRNDYIGLEYYHCELIRKRRRKNPEQLARLAKHDLEEKRVFADPQATLREAHTAIDHGSSLLLKLIRSGRLFHAVEPTEKGKAEGVKTRKWDEAFDCLASRVTYLNDQLIRLAEDRVPRACRQLWFDASKLAEAFTQLASLYPDEFRDVAEKCVTMPSVRGRNPKFTADAEAIVRAIHLGEKHPSANVWDNKSRVGAQCHMLVARVIENIHYARDEYDRETEELNMWQNSPALAAEYHGVTVEQLVQYRLPARSFENIMACAALPDWEDDPKHGGRGVYCR